MKTLHAGRIILLLNALFLFSTIQSSPEAQLKKSKDPQKFEKHTLSPGMIMAGYQGWFNAPDDGANRGWYHYGKGGKFEPVFCKVDMWPDMTEYEKQYVTAFTYADGQPATTLSSHDESTVRLHFKWMKEYGIDGVYLQRFVGEIKSKSGLSHFNKVLTSAVKSSLEYDRTICVMYDMSGMHSEDVDVMMADWKALMKEFGFNKRSRFPNYLFDRDRPVIAIWGIGFNDGRKYNLADIEKLIRFYKSEEGGNCSVLLGVPTYWREQGSDCIKDSNFLDIIQMADIVHPWFVGRFNEQGYDAFKPLIGKDQKWCDEHHLKYMPVVFPGFSWNNMYPESKNSFVPRNHGKFFWKQLSGAASEGARMIYVAMFDEIDEGTAIFKCAKRVPVCEGSKFVPINEDISSDHYLWLTGKAGQLLKEKKQIPTLKPVQHVTK
ncbi:MAG: glycoside hydrolase family 71/99-like protein [Bacteroidales bacterium]|nr:glycoside hydrolase family 71/99-like protein [Bacteroidales bacterium]